MPTAACVNLLSDARIINETLLKTYIGALLVEAKADNLKKKFPSLVPEIDKLNQSLPVKYLDWAVKQLDAGSDVNDIVSACQFFDKNVKRFSNKDINSYKALSDLENEVKSLGKSSSEKRKETKLRGAEKLALYDDRLSDRFDFLWIKSKNAAACYGAGTQWCITMRNELHWEHYIDKNVVFYFLIDKIMADWEPVHKFAIAVTRDLKDDTKILQIDVYDAEDTRMSIDEVPKYVRQFVNVAINDAKSRRSLSQRVLLAQGKLDTKGTLALMNDKSESVRSDVAKHINLDLLPQMMNDKAWSVRAIVASRINQRYLPQMMNDENDIVRCKVADRIDKSYVQQMMHDKSSGVRFRIAARSDSQQRLPQMIKDDSPRVREFVARNIDHSYLPQMIDDEDTYVRMYVAQRIDSSYLQDMLEKEDNDIVIADIVNRLGSVSFSLGAL